MRNLYVLVVKPEERRPLVKPVHKYEDNVRMDLTEIRSGGMDWIYLAQFRDQWLALVNMVMSLQIP
jgi:hypothetical protein